MKAKRLFLMCVIVLFPLFAMAQDDDKSASTEAEVSSLAPETQLKKTVLDGENALLMEMHNVYVYPVMELKSERQRKAFNRLVNNVKKVLPIAKDANKIIIETYEYLETLPDKKSREAHMKLVEAEIYQTYKPKMKKLTYSQGKLLIKLVNRECNSSSYDIVRAFMGPIRAGFWQAFAWTFGASLKKEYRPESTDRLTERVVLMVESGQL